MNVRELREALKDAKDDDEVWLDGPIPGQTRIRLAEAERVNCFGLFDGKYQNGWIFALTGIKDDA